jgi:uncharacterized membrane protein YbjE (DUF340 family)
MLLIISLMAAGLVFGVILSSRAGERVFKAFGRIQQAATIALLFAMGLWLGGNPEFWQNVSTTGLHGFLLALLLVFLCGRFLPALPHDAVNNAITICIALVVFAAGVDVGTKKTIFRKLAEYREKVLLIPLGTVLGSVLAGGLLGAALGLPVNEAAAVTSGLGYYSVSSGILTGLDGAGLGALAFITNVFRELMALIITPFVAKYISPYCAVTPGGATSMDTTLGIISRSTNEEITVIAMLHGVILTVVVPILVPFLYNLPI